MSQKNKLQLTLDAGQHDATFTREFDAPRDLVFQTMFSAEGIPQWWGDSPKVEQFDVTPGGSWAVTFKNPNGWEARMRGVFHDVQAPERIVRTFEFMPGKVLLETTTLEDVNGRTKLTQQQLYQSIADRDQVAQYGMEKGASASFDKLEEVLEKQAQIA